MPTSVTPKVLIVSVPNAILSRAVQELAFKVGYKWPTGGTDIYEPSRPYVALLAIGAYQPVLQSIADQSQFLKRYPDALTLDSRTDLGQLIDLLTPIKPTPVAPRVNGYDASYLKGAPVVRFGCAHISIDMLKEAGHLMSRGLWAGNREVYVIQFHSGVTLNVDQVKAILTYVDEVNKLG